MFPWKLDVLKESNNITWKNLWEFEFGGTVPDINTGNSINAEMHLNLRNIIDVILNNDINKRWWD